MRRQRQWMVLGAAVVALAAGGAAAQDVVTSFEFEDLSGEFVLGTPPATVTFRGGLAQEVDKGLARTGTHGWVVASGAKTPAEIEFDRPARELELWFINGSAGVGSMVTVWDVFDNMVGMFHGDAAYMSVSLVRGPGELPIARVMVEHIGGEGVIVLDDVSYTAGAGGTPIVNPFEDVMPRGDFGVSLRIVASGLVAPNWGVPAPGHSGRMFVTDQVGVVWNINLADNSRSVFLDVSSRLVPLGIGGPGTFDERGLLGLAFHPDYAENGLLYTYTSEPDSEEPDFTTMPEGVNPNHQSVIAEWRVADPSDPDAVVDLKSRREVLRIDQPQFNHDGGALAFGPDGMMLISLGDGGGRDDEPVGHGTIGNGQDVTTILGSVLRIDVDGRDSANGQYGIPTENPFVKGGPEGALHEILHWGLRNPFRISFDTATGDLYIADVGQGAIEELNIVRANDDPTRDRNFGWRLKEGSFFFDPAGGSPGFVTDIPVAPVPPDVVDPDAEYDHDDGIAIIGGFVYHGASINNLAGIYVCGDYADRATRINGRMFYVTADNEFRELWQPGRSSLAMNVLGFGQDAAGEVYLLANTTGVPSGDTGVVMMLVPPCAADWDRNGIVNSADVGAFLTSYFDDISSDPPGLSADFDGSGITNSNDVGAFLTAYFQGVGACP